MAREYNPEEIEKKWQNQWQKSGLYRAEDNSQKPKYYTLIEFPYPSGDGLHVGHPRPYIGLDVIARKRRMEGFNVLYPIGWDAFGLPTENYALKTGKNPRVVTKENSDTFRRQIQSLGISFDWSREINTTDPKYYKWTQWIFLKFLEKGLAYKARIPINWCPKDKIGLANEEVVDGKCERCGTPVEQKEKEQWMLAITKYADRLEKDLDEVDYPERVKVQQRNWIGKSIGAEIDFQLTTDNSQPTTLKVFTTRPDTIFGATFLVKAGKEDRFTGQYAINPATKEEIPIWEAEYVMGDYGTGAIMAVPAHDQRDFEFAVKYNLPIKHVVIPKLIDYKNPHREGKRVVFRNAVIIILKNPKTEKILTLKWKKQPWTTFIMGGIEDGENPIDTAVREIQEETGYKNVKFIKKLGGPIHNEFFAAHKDENRTAHTQGLLFELIDEEKGETKLDSYEDFDVVWADPREINPEVMTHTETATLLEKMDGGSEVYAGEGILINSVEFDNQKSEEARKEITEKFGKKVIKYKLRDWVFSRQRYWGEPIPVIHCSKCGVVPVPEKDLPVVLPEVEKYEPGPDGESPLANIKEFVDTECPQCGGKAKRETDVMPNWAGSSWYYFAYCISENLKSEALISKQITSTEIQNKFNYWMPVDWYNGGMEHTVLHLLYSRFWNKFLFDLGLVPTSEPYKKRTSHGLILAEGGEKMSKSKGNVINPDSIVEHFGADTLRLYEMFMGPFEQAIEWNESSLVGPRRFLEKVWRLGHKVSNSQFPISNEFSMNQTIKRVSDDIENLGFNTAVSALMIYANALDKQDRITQQEFETLLLLLAPFAPHIVEELWTSLGHKDSIHTQSWPVYDPKKIEEDEVVMGVQVNGKVRASLSVRRGQDEEEIRTKALSMPEVQKWLGGKEPKKVIVVPGRVVSIVT
ncbi:MAG: class I tRNA ligase family protein [bacterium]|nr:class I tRNA ligase family protein [bacterium]